MFRQFQHAECGISNNKDKVTKESSHDGTNWTGSMGGSNYCEEWRKDTLWNISGSENCTVCVVQDGVKATLKRWLTNKAAVRAKNHKVRTIAIEEALKLCNDNKIWDRTDIWGANLQYKEKTDSTKKMKKELEKTKRAKLKAVAEKLTTVVRGKNVLNASVLSCANYSYAKVAKQNRALNQVNTKWNPRVSDIIDVNATKEWFAHYIVMKMILEPCYELNNTSSSFPECKKLPFLDVVRGPDSNTRAKDAFAATDAVGHQHASHNLGAIIAFENTDLNAEREFLSTIGNIGGRLLEVHKFLYGRSPPNNNYWLLGATWG